MAIRPLKSDWDWAKVVAKVMRMTDLELEIIWDALRRYDPNEEYLPGIPMDDWAQLIYSERGRRKAEKVVPVEENKSFNTPEELIHMLRSLGLGVNKKTRVQLVPHGIKRYCYPKYVNESKVNEQVSDLVEFPGGTGFAYIPELDILVVERSKFEQNDDPKLEILVEEYDAYLVVWCDPKYDELIKNIPGVSFVANRIMDSVTVYFNKRYDKKLIAKQISNLKYQKEY